MSGIPGSIGYGIFGDKSIEFYKGPIEFAEKRIRKYGSRIFVSRLLNKPTVFICSYDGVQKTLKECASSMEMGYKALWHELFGDSILFIEDASARDMKAVLHSLFVGSTMEEMCVKVDTETKRTLDFIQPGAKIDVYPYIKKFTTSLCLSIFLGVDQVRSAELAAELATLSINHWHGIISVPLQVRGPLVGSSTYAKAMNAKNRLMTYIRNHLPQLALHFPSEDAAVDHILLFTCALIPKSLSSILTSFFLASCRQTAYQQNTDDALLSAALLEVMRLWPPFLGGRRLIRQSAMLDNHQLPEGYAVVYNSYMAHRDPSRFVEPEEFMPERWLKDLQDRDPASILTQELFTLGYGPRQCCGQALIWKILKTFCTELIKRYSWRAIECDIADVEYKYLPVLRPVTDFFINFSMK